MRTVTKRGQRTRRALLTAARRVFERDGFLEARVTDISTEANVSHGTFYTYFDSKDDVFREVVKTVSDEMMQLADPPPAVRELEAIGRFTTANRTFLDSYQAYTRIIALVEQVATFDDEMRELRRSTREHFVRRAERQICRLEADGVTDVALDPHYLAEALCSMVERFAYVWMVLGEEYEFEAALRTLNTVWCRALGLEDPPND